METISRKERLAVVAGLLMGEGCIYAQLDNCARGKQIEVTIKIGNTDMGIIQRISEVLFENDIRFWYASGGKKTPNLVIGISGFRQIQKFLSLVMPYLCGSKKEQAERMLQLVAHRQSQYKMPADERETAQLIQEIKNLKRQKISPLDCIRAANQPLQFRNPQRLDASSPNGGKLQSILCSDAKLI